MKCIVFREWGHDFRPEYRRLREMMDLIDEKIPVIALTATAYSQSTKRYHQKPGPAQTEDLHLFVQPAEPSLRNSSQDQPGTNEQKHRAFHPAA